MKSLKELFAEIKVRADKAHREICNLAQGKRRWEMCIPVQATDSDMVLQAPLDDQGKLLAVIEKLIEQRDYYIHACNRSPLIEEQNAELAKILEGAE